MSNIENLESILDISERLRYFAATTLANLRQAELAATTANSASKEISAIADELDQLSVSTGDDIHKRFELQQRLRKLLA